MEEPTEESIVVLTARRRQTNRLIALGLAFCIVTIFAVAMGFAIVSHDMSGHPLIH